MGLSLAACVPAGRSPPAYLIDPADPDRPVPPLVYESVTSGTKTFRPVDPKGWEQQNKDAAPKPGEEGMGGMDHGSMKGMDHGGMKGMGGMDHGGMKGMGAGPKDNGDDGKKGTNGGGMNDMDGMKGMGGK